MHTETYVDGIWYPSITTIIGAQPHPWLDTWRAKWGSLADRKVKAASDVGTQFHSCVEQYLDTGGYIIPSTSSYYSRVNGMMQSFIQWAVSVNGEVHATELKVISKLHTFSGTLDGVGLFEGKPTVYDWKTSARIYDDYQLQLVAYAQAYKEQTGIEIKQGLIVHVSKDKPHYKLTTKSFKLGKRVLNKFLKLRAMFDDVKLQEGLNAENTNDSKAAGY